MLLLQLPLEILFQIFDFIPSSYFRSDVSRLAVCKQWSKIAYTACFRDFYVTQKTLRRLLSPPYVESGLSLVKDRMEILDLDLKGFEDWDSIPLSRDDLAVANDMIMPTWYSTTRGREVSRAWTTELNNDLLYLSTMITSSQKLRVLRIRATVELHPQLPFPEGRDYLFLSTIGPFLSASNITILELDLCGTKLIPPQSQEQGEVLHLCTTIAALLTTLRRLRLRMLLICTHVLKPPETATNLRLNEVLINLSLPTEPFLTPSPRIATCCGSDIFSFIDLTGDMEKQARNLAARMAAPKVVRVLSKGFPNFELRAFDVLTGKYIRLGQGAEWDDDGKTVEEEVPDEKSEIPDWVF